MRKRIGSLLLSLALCLTLLPTAAFAEKAQPEEPLPGEQLEQVQPVPEEPEENEEPSRQDGDVIAVQEMINALPDASELDEMDAEAQESACLAASEAYDAYDALPEEQQSALTGADNMLAILEWTTRQIELLANEDLSDHTTHGEGWTAINSEEGLKNLTGKGYLTDNVTLSDTWKPDNGVVLCLNGKTITGANGQNAIQVNSGVTFTLTDCKNTGEITHATGQTGRGVTVDTGGTFHMYGGSISHNEVTNGYVRQGSGVTVNAGGAFHMYGGSISGNKVSGSNSVGGGVYVGSGTFHMYGGSIADNTAQSGGGVYVGTSTFHMYGGSISGNTAESGNGGGVFVVSGGKFNMSGGTIGGAGNAANTAKNNGGGVYSSGTFTMSGGAITGNNAAKNGGGVAVNGTFTMSGGEITGNTASGYGDGGGVYVNYDGTFQMSDDSRITGNTGYRGGGVSVERSYSTTNNPGAFTMSSGRITDNNAQYGGGVYISGNFTMSGGEISSNKATGNSGGVHMNTDSTFTVSGAPKITGNTLKNSTTNNVRLSKGTTTGTSPKPDATITIGDAHLSTGASIGVTTDKTLTTGSSVTIATGAISGDEKYFTSDADRDYHFVLDGNEVKLGQHEHNWQYTLSEDKTTITAKCTAEGCSLAGGLGGTLTLIPPQNSTYDGTPKAVKLDSTLDSSITKPKIMYQQGEAVLNTDPPTDAGTYTASIKLTGADGQTATASVEYTIAKATPTVDNFTFTAPSTADLIYNGNAKIAAVKAKDGVTGMGNITVKYFKDDEPVNEAKEVGNYTVKISMDDTGNNYHATTEDLTKGEWKFTIGKGTQTVNVPTGKTIVKNGREVDISDWATVSGVEGGKTPGTLSYTLIGNPVGITLADNKLKADPGTTESAFEIKATAAATNDYNEASQTFTVTVTDKKPANLSVSMTGWTYGESANKPGYTVPEGVTATVTYGKADGTALSERPTDAGNYTVKVQYETDTNIYTGTAEFTISKREIAVPTADPMQFEYTGQEQTYVLSNFADASYYTVSNTMKRTDAGSQNVTVQLNDKSNTVWEDGTDEDKTYVFTIAPKPLSKVTIGDFPDKTYTGLSIQPAVAPVDGNTALTENTDYTVSYGANTNVGKATITVTGTGNYTGTVSKEWKITPAVLTISGVTVVDKTYNGSADATVTAVAFNGLKNGEELVIGTDYEVHGAAFNDENVDAANKVTGTVALKNTEKTKNYTLSSATFEQAAAIGRADYNGTASTTINIVKGRSTAQTGTLTAADFFPEGQMPADAAIVSVTPNSGTIIESIAVDGTNHKLDYVSKTNIAAAADESYTVTIATTNYKDITATLTFHPTDKLVQDGFKFENGSVTKTYGDEDFTLTTIGEVKGSTVTYESSEPAVAAVDSATGKVTIKGAGTAVITAKAAATDEYDEAVATCTLTVEKKLIAIPTADATVFTYNGKPQTYALVENEAYTVSGNVQTDANETGYSVKAALKDTANTQWADGMTADKTYTFVIGKAVITVTAKDQTAYVGDKAPELGEDSYTVSGLVGEEKLTTQPTVKYVDADGKEITPDMTKTGEIKILASGAAASDNYTIRYEDGKLTVSTRPSSGSSSNNSSYTVSVDKTENGAITVSPKSASKGDTVTITVKPDKGYELDTLKVLDKNGDKVKLTEKNGKYTFTMPAGKVTVKGSFVEEAPEQIFADVPVDAYYYEAVKWAVEKDITGGIGNGLFAPKLNCTRAQIVTFLWRAVGSPEPKSANSFADVSADSYYAKAVAWAVENGITGGTGNGKFSPNATCTREQAVAFLYRASGSPAVSGGSAFSDVAASAYYADAVAWAEQNGVTGGIGNGEFGTGSDCTRAQIVTFLYRAYQGK